LYDPQSKKPMKNLILFAAVLVLSCQAPSKPDIQTEMQDLQKAAEAYNNSLVNLKMDEAKTFYTQDAWFFPPGEATLHGYGDIAKYVDNFKQAKNLVATISDSEVSVSPSGGSGYSIANTSLTFDDADGKTIKENFRDVHFWIKQANGSWKIAVDIWNAPPPSAP